MGSLIKALTPNTCVMPHLIPVSGAWYRIINVEEGEIESAGKSSKGVNKVWIQHLDGSEVCKGKVPWVCGVNQSKCLAEISRDDTNALKGRLVFLICDPDVPNPGGGKPGGIRITGAADLGPDHTDKTEVSIPVKLGGGNKRTTYTIRRLPSPVDPPAPGQDPIAAVAETFGATVAAIEEAIGRAIRRPVQPDAFNRHRLANWARTEKGEAAIRAHLTPAAS